VVNYILVISHWNGRLHWPVMMEYSSFGKTLNDTAYSSENGQIIRENVNGTKEVIVDEGDMINVHPI
jgi:hypothetical protein